MRRHPSNRRSMRTSIPFLFCCALLAGCATNFEPKPLPANHPASVHAQEAPRSHIKRLITTDVLTQTTKAQLTTKEAPTPDFQDNGKSKDMGSMEGMDQSRTKVIPPAPDPTASPARIIYTCVMHPEVQQPTPGKCPKCGMTLVKKEGALP